MGAVDVAGFDVLGGVDEGAIVHFGELFVPGGEFFRELDGILEAEALAEPGIFHGVCDIRGRYEDDLEAVLAPEAVVGLDLLEHYLHLACYVH